MSLEVRHDLDGVDWTEAASLVTRAPLGERNPEELKKAFCASDLVCMIYDGTLLVGVGRALTDEVYQAGIYDICVLPEYQGRGVGKQVVESLLARLGNLTVILFAEPGKENFYRKLGFRPLKTGMGIFSSYTDSEKDRFLEP